MLQLHYYPRNNKVFLVYVEEDGIVAERIEITKLFHDELFSKHNVKRIIIR